MIWLQCKEDVLLKIGQRAVAKGCNLILTEKQGEVFVVEYEEPVATSKKKNGQYVLPSEADKYKMEYDPDKDKMIKVRKTYKRYTGFIEQGHNDWYLILIHPMLYEDLVAGIPLGPNVKVSGGLLINTCVPHSRQYVYFNDAKDIVTNFTQHYEINI